jgi:hypothetical protein
MKKEIKKIYPKIIRGAGGGGSPPPCYPSPPPDPHTPVEALEGIDKNGARSVSRTETETTDLISEGPIEGLVSGSYNFVGQVGKIGWDNYNFNVYSSKNNNPYLRSVYWRNIPLIDDAGNYNYTQINFRYDNGNQVRAYNLTSQINDQTNTNVIPQASRTLSIGDVLRYGPDFVKQYDFRSTNISQIIISLKVEGLYDQQNDPNVDKKTFNLGCGQTVKISQTVGDIREREITYNFKIYKITKSGLVLVINQNDRSYGKITSGVIDKFTFNLSNTNPDQDDFLGYRVRIERTSAESTKINLRDAVSVHAITEVFREDYVYPKAAVFKSLFTSEFFPDVPARTYDVKLLKVKIPSNYDPIKKSYNGDWDGRFSDEYHPSGVGLYWTDNPAWCYYDLLTNKRYGLGKYIPNGNVDKWNLYQIAQYCDTIVDDGFGGLEPRFTCNAIVNDFSDAFSLLNDFASIFRGMSYYSNGSIYAIADSPKEPFILFTNSNVENGDFNYSSSSKKTRNTVSVIRYNDMANFAKPTIEYVEDPEGVRKYGIRKVEITAFGCTSRGQAYRLGRWALASEQLETETVDFVAGLESLYLKPGDIIKIQDSNRILERLGGRVLAISTGVGGIHKFVLDEEFSQISGYFSTYFPSNPYHKFEILTPGFRVTGTNYSDFLTGYDRSEIQSGLFNLNNLSPATGYDPERTLTEINCNKIFDTTNYILGTGTTWTVQTTGSGNNYGLNAETELYRVIGINEVEPNKYNVNALEYNPSKYAFIESGITISDSPSVNPVVIKEASYPSGIFLYTGSDKLYLNYRISGAVDTGINKETAYWRIYAKNGSDFSLGTDTVIEYANINGTVVNVPKSEYLIDNLNVTGISPISGNFIPTGNNTTYYFRVYGQNSRGYYSRDYSSGTFFYNSEYLEDYTNLLVLENFKYKTQNDNLATVGLNLPSGNLFHSSDLDVQWQIDNLATILKTWNNENLTYRLVFGTGNFNPSASYTNNIGTYYLNLDNSAGEYSAYTGWDETKLVEILTDHTISGFWLAIDASGVSGTKYSSQLTQASQNYTKSDGYLFGEFNNESLKNRINIDNADAYIDSNSNLQIVIPNLPSDMGNIYAFFTDDVSKTGFLTESNLNKIISQQFVSPYTSFIKALKNSGIQMREAFFDGSSRFGTSDPFTSTVSTILKNGYFTLRTSSTFSDMLCNQYNKSFVDGSIYDSGNYPAQAPQAVYYGSYPTGIVATYRWPNTDGLGNPINPDRQIANNIMFLPQLSNLPLFLSGQLTEVSSSSDLTGVSGYLQSQINSLSGTLTGNYFKYNTNNIADLKVSGNVYISGNLNITGGSNLLYSPTSVVDSTTRTYAPSGYFSVTINGTGVRVPYFRAT